MRGARKRTRRSPLATLPDPSFPLGTPRRGRHTRTVYTGETASIRDRARGFPRSVQHCVRRDEIVTSSDSSNTSLDYLPKFQPAAQTGDPSSLTACQLKCIFNPRPRRRRSKLACVNELSVHNRENCSSVSRRGTFQGRSLRTARFLSRGRFIRGLRRSGFIEDEHRLMARPAGQIPAKTS